MCVCVAGVGRQEAQQWCLAHAFELVELSPQDLPDEDGDLFILLLFHVNHYGNRSLS